MEAGARVLPCAGGCPGLWVPPGRAYDAKNMLAVPGLVEESRWGAPVMALPVLGTMVGASSACCCFGRLPARE